MAYIVDIDGTVANNRHREHYLHNSPPDWDSFHAACGLDELIEPVAQIVVALQESGHEVIFLTGRYESARDVTNHWLIQNELMNAVKPAILMMRPNGLQIEAKEFKLKSLLSLQDQGFRIDGCFEDNSRVTSYLREKGYTVFSVADHNY